MKHRSLCLLLVALAFPLSACAEEFAARRYTAADGASIGYRLLAPEKLEVGRKYPLVLFLHGAGERGDDNAAQMTHGVAAFASNALFRMISAATIAQISQASAPVIVAKLRRA